MKKNGNVKINKQFTFLAFMISIITLIIFTPISLGLTIDVEKRVEELKILDEENKERLTLPIATIDFVQPYLLSEYSETEMDDYVKMLKRAGYEAVIIQNIMNIEGGKNSEIKVTESWYDSNLIQDETTLQAYKPKMLDTLVKAIQDNNMKIYIGLASSNDWWSSNFTDDGWRTKNIKFLNDMIDEIYQKYEKYECFEGIYWTNEIYTNGDDYYSYWTEMINSNIEHLQKIDVGEKKHTFMLSPFVSQIYELTYEQVYKDWKKMIDEINFRQGDIICMQDGFGTSSFEPSKVQKYLEAIRQAVKSDNKRGLEFWLNVENYADINGEGKPSTLERYILQLSICSKYAEKLTSFSYSHYYNPYVSDANFDEQYRQYYKSIIEEKNENDNKIEVDNNNEIDNVIDNKTDNETEESDKTEEGNKTQNEIKPQDETVKDYDKEDTAKGPIPQAGENVILEKIIFAMIIGIILFLIIKYIKLQFE